MSIQSDNWISYMAKKYNMIEPFIDKQVRYAQDDKRRVVSYGLSSYGYDLRVADEFKIFTNTLNSIVDPKKFDENSFVNVKSDVCVVPPNSFALARSIEYFKIPKEFSSNSFGSTIEFKTLVKILNSSATRKS